MLLGSLALLLAGACAEPATSDSHAGAESAKPATAAAPPTVAGPGEVLDGTDLLAIAEVERVPLPKQPEGTYRSEQGGAEADLVVARSGDGWTVTRTYREPTLDPETRTYPATRRGETLVSAQGGLVVQGTTQGLLVLEPDSGCEAIPGDYWIHYRRAE